VTQSSGIINVDNLLAEVIWLTSAKV